jgi:hypothetical protein
MILRKRLRQDAVDSIDTVTQISISCSDLGFLLFVK